MSGYTPLFQSLTTGTLCGKWPDIGLWPIVLSLADRHGVVDVTPQYLAGVTGLPVAEVEACMERFCQPDKYSRSSEEGGARLRLVEPESRNWGWIVVNHRKYSEKARKSAYDSDRVASGEDAARKRHERATSRAEGPRPAPSRALPLSDKTRLRQDKSKSAPPQDVPHGTFDGWEFIDQRMRPNYPAGQYPPTAWINAARTVERLHLEQGVKLEDIEAGAKRFNASCIADGSVGSRFIVNPDRFLAEARYTLPYTVTVQQGKPGEDPEAVQAWEKLLATDGAERSPQVHQALQAIGGWPRVRERTSKDTAYLRRDFIAAYSNARAAA